VEDYLFIPVIQQDHVYTTLVHLLQVMLLLSVITEKNFTFVFRFF